MADLPRAGLIFVRSEDIVSQVAISITKQPYSNIGFFYKKTIRGQTKIGLVILDVNRFSTPEWLHEGDTLEELISNPLVSSIALKGLSPLRNKQGQIDEQETEKLHTKFRAAIAKVTARGHKQSSHETIAQLFGYEVKHPSKGVTAVEMVNRVIVEMGKSELIPQNGSLDAETLRLLEPPEHLSIDARGKIQMIQVLTSKFNQQEIDRPGVAEKLMQSYIIDNGLFDDLIEIELPERNLHNLRRAQRASEALNRSYLARLADTFISMSIEDQGFYETVARGVNQTRSVEVGETEAMKRNMVRLARDSEQLSQLVSDWLQSGEMPYERLLKSITGANQRRNKISRYQQLPLPPPVKLPHLERTKLLLVTKNQEKSDRDKNVSGKKELDSSQVNVGGKDEPKCRAAAEAGNCRAAAEAGKCRAEEKAQEGQRKPTEQLLGSCLFLRKRMARISEQVEKGELAIIELNSLLRAINQMSHSLGLEVEQLPELSGQHSVNALIDVTSSDSDTLSLTIKSRRVVLTTDNPHFDGLDLETLHEILITIDGMASANQRFDHLRKSLVQRINELETTLQSRGTSSET